MQTILGAGGNIGGQLALELSKFTSEIRLVSRNPLKVNVNDQIFQANLTVKDELFSAVKGSKIVYVTIAFEYKADIWEKLWVPFARNVVDACKEYGSKLVFFDNIYMYDKNELSNLTESSKENPCSRKGRVRKQVADIITSAYSSGEIKGLIARAPDFLSPKNSILIETVYNNFLNGKKAVWLGDANKLHSFIYYIDAAKATAILGNSDFAYNQIWHLPANQSKMKVSEWIELFANEMGTENKYTTFAPYLFPLLGLFIPPVREIKELSYQLDRDYYINSEKFCRAFNYQPVHPSIAVKEIVELLKKGN